MAFILAAIAVVVLTLPAVASASGYVYQDKWGSAGTAAGQFSGGIVYGVALDHHGAVYVVDSGNDRVQEFTTDGSFIRQWGSVGSGAGQFSGPRGVAVDRYGFVYVADFGNNRVQVFDAAGTYVRQFGSAGSGAGQFNGPYGIAVDSNDNVSVVDFSNNRVEVFDSAGAWVRTITGNGSAFAGVFGVAVDASGSVYVCDRVNNRIQVFDSTGAFVTQWTTPDQPSSAGIGPDGNVFVGVYTTGHIYEYMPDGTPLGFFGNGLGTGDGQFTEPVYGIDVNAAGTVFVADGWGKRVETFALDDTPPVVTNDADGEWHNTDQQVTLAATDDLSGVAYIAYSQDGGGWTGVGGTPVLLPPITALADHSHDGVHTIIYYASDNVDNATANRTCRVRIDTRKPVTTVSGVPTRWVKSAVTLHFTPTDIGSGVDQTLITLNGGPPTQTLDASGDFVASSAGVTSVAYYSVDSVVDTPNFEDTKYVEVKIDPVRPVPLALNNVAVEGGATAKLKYKVTEPVGLSPTCAMKIVIKKGTKIVKTIKLGAIAVNSAKTKNFVAALPAGNYTWSVYATDLAGNTQAKPGVKKLTVL